MKTAVILRLTVTALLMSSSGGAFAGNPDKEAYEPVGGRQGGDQKQTKI